MSAVRRFGYRWISRHVSRTAFRRECSEFRTASQVANPYLFELTGLLILRRCGTALALPFLHKAQWEERMKRCDRKVDIGRRWFLSGAGVAAAGAAAATVDPK